MKRKIFAGGNHSWLLQKYEKQNYNTAEAINDRLQIEMVENDHHSYIDRMSKNTNPSLINMKSPVSSISEVPNSDVKLRLVVNQKKTLSVSTNLKLSHLFIRFDL